MALQGDLTSVGLADVFQMLALNRKQGILCITGVDRWRALYFDVRGVTLYYNEHIFLDRVLDSLVRRHFLGADVLAALRRENSGDPIGTVEAILSSGVVPEEAFLSSFREEMEEQIYDLFLWENVHWEFLEGVDQLPGREGVINENFSLNSDSLVMEAARRLDEWGFIKEVVPGPMSVFEPVEQTLGEAVVGLDENVLALLDLIDGKRSMERIVEMSGLTPFHVFKEVSQLVQEGYVRPIDEGQLLPRAEECMSAGRFDDALHLLESAISVGAGLPHSYKRAAQTYESLQEFARAIWHYKNYSNAMVEAGNVEEAVAVLEHCLELIPTDLDALERLVQALSLQDLPTHDPHSVGKELIDIYLDLDETERARKVLEGLLQVRPADVELKKTLIAVHTKAGDTRRVMELYEAIAEDLVKQKDPIGAVRYLQKILMIDRNRRDISDRIKQLYVIDEKHRSRRRGMFMMLASMLCLVAIGSFYYLYEQNVSRVIQEINVEPLIERKDYAGAIARYEQVLDEYPLTLKRNYILTQIERIRSLKALDEARKERQDRVLKKIAEQKRKEYLRLWRHNVKTFPEEKSVEKALDRLDNILRLVKEADQPQDRAWRKKVELDAAIEELRNYIARAGSLARQVSECLRDGRRDRARSLAVELHRDYPFAKPAGSTLVPFRLESKPQGAVLKRAGKPIMRRGRPVTTPAWLQLPYEDTVRIQLEKDGFKTYTVAVRGKDPSPRVVVLPVKPDVVLTLDELPQTSPLFKGRIGVAALSGGRVQAFSSSTGKARWTIKLQGLERVKFQPILAGDLVIFATTGTNSRVIAVRIDDGAEQWRVPVSSGVSSRLVPGDGAFAFVSGDGIVRVHANSGKLLWAHPTQSSPVGEPRWESGSLVYATSSSILVFDPKGKVQRKIDTEVSIAGTPEVIGGLYFVPSSDGQVHALDAKGRLIWKKRVAEQFEPIQLYGDAQGIVSLSLNSGEIWRFRSETGEAIANRKLNGAILGRPLIRRDLMYIASNAKKSSSTTAIDVRGSSLSVLWEYKLDAPLVGPPSIIGNRVAVVSKARRIHVLR